MAANRVAVITGASRGIGLAAVELLAKQNPEWTVVLCARSEQAGQERVTELKGKGLNNVVAHQLDVSSDDSVKSFGEWVKSTYGRIDVLVNNAGITSDDRGPFLESSLEKVREVFETNTLGPLRMCQTFVPLMKERNYGRIINVSSGMGQLSEMNGTAVPYRLSKVSLNALTRIVGEEVKSFNIHVNSMCPGFVDTDMLRDYTKGNVPATAITPEQGADTIVWLATQGDDGPRSGFFRRRAPVAW